MLEEHEAVKIKLRDKVSKTEAVFTGVIIKVTNTIITIKCGEDCYKYNRQKGRFNVQLKLKFEAISILL
jgi:hypothetical protein